MLGRLEDAEAALREALALRTPHPEAHFHLGECFGRQRKFDEAEREFRIAIEQNPDAARPHHGLGVTQAHRGRFDDAIAHLSRAIELRPDYAEAYQALGVCRHFKREPQLAADAYRKVVELRPNNLNAKIHLAGALEQSGDRDGAAEQYRRVLERRPDVAEVAFSLAAMQEDAPPTAPASYIINCFDHYAARFDEHLLNVLEYRAPQRLFEAAQRFNRRSELDVLDLGCGTGLCGALFRPIARTLHGVDLSPAMLDVARQKNTYDDLRVGDIAQPLDLPLDSYDLVLSADVLIYVGDLSPVLKNVATKLKPGGLFAFTVEAEQSDRFTLRHTRRYTHGDGYVRTVCESEGFEVLALEGGVLRNEGKKPVDGWVVVLRVN